MLSGDVYNEQIARYEFASDYVSKRILNITNFRFLEYFSSKLLLEKNVTEIVSGYKNEGNSEYTLRWKNKENSMKFEIVNENNVFKENSFDGVILFETIQHEENQKEMLKRIYKLLKNDGILIISTTNKKSSHGRYNMTKNKINKELDKEELLELLKEVFSKVDLFTQNILNYKQELLGIIIFLETKDLGSMVERRHLLLFVEKLPWLLMEMKLKCGATENKQGLSCMLMNV